MERFPIILIPRHLSHSLPNASDRGSALPPTGAHHHPPKGYSETAFERELWTYFPGKVHAGLTMKRPELNQPYIPDFTYLDTNLEIYLDIEIDEPYSHVDRQPIHYLNCEKDQIRNDCFLSWGWVVIRFSERQVIQHPASCCKAIASTLATLTGNSAFMLPFRQIPTLKPEKRWTVEEAQAMAASDYREQYRRSAVPNEPAAKRRRKQAAPDSQLMTATLTFHCPQCGERVRWQGHYVCCSTCGYDSFVL